MSSAEAAVTGAQQERRRRILDATIALASEGGFDAVQMRAVADHADVALGTLYRYFPSKVHLLVAALRRELERVDARLAGEPVPGDTPADRVIHVVRTASRGLRGDQHLTEALTRAFVFADGSARHEIDAVSVLLTSMLTRAMHPEQAAPADEDTAVARVIGDVWFSALIAWVTGRSTSQETADHLERTVRLLLR